MPIQRRVTTMSKILMISVSAVTCALLVAGQNVWASSYGPDRCAPKCAPIIKPVCVPAPVCGPELRTERRTILVPEVKTECRTVSKTVLREQECDREVTVLKHVPETVRSEE